MSAHRPFSREELLGGPGLPARQASLLLFAIESRTAQLVSESRQAMALYLTESALAANNKAFLDAIAQGGNLPIQPSIQEMETFAPQWADLVADNPNLRAAVARRLAQKYRFTQAATPRMTVALGLEQTEVREAFHRLYAEPLDSIFAPDLDNLERLRWTWRSVATWLESRPPFWTAFALVLTETVGAGILALPIAVAGVGPIAGVVLLLVLGLVNVLTIAAISEAVARNGQVRFGHAYFGRVVADNLGTAGSAIFSLALLILNGLTVLVYFIGLGLTMSLATGVPAAVWVTVIFLICIYFLSRKTLNMTVASALLVGGINIVLILILSALAFSRLQLDNLTYLNLPLLGGEPFDVGLLETIFGVVLLAYFGHTSTANCAKVVLKRDESARSLIWGCVAATLAAMCVYCVWIVAVAGAVSPTQLAQESGTALAPLAEEIGPSIHVFGVVFVALSMGMGSIHTGLGLFYATQERLPTRITQGSRTVLAMSPVVVIFVATQLLLWTERESFTRPLSFAGTITATVVAGIFPVLMLRASRRKGERVPGLVLRGLGHPVVLVTLYLIFLSSIVLHGLVIWQNPLERGVALMTALLLVGATILMFKRGRFRPRLVIELFVDETDAHANQPRATLRSTAHGHLVSADVTLTHGLRGQPPQEQSLDPSGLVPDFTHLERIRVRMADPGCQELLVWVHRASSAGTSESIPAGLLLRSGHEMAPEVELSGNELVAHLPPGEVDLMITLGDPKSDHLSGRKVGDHF